MSMHEWYNIIYGIKFPFVKADGDKILAFIENHKECFYGEDLPETAEEAVEYAHYFEDDKGWMGLAAFISFVASKKYIHMVEDEYDTVYIGIYADTLFPWDTPNADWASIKREDIENEIRSLVEELGINCPEFKEHIVWQCG